MINTKTFAVVALATLALAAGDLSASAQSSLTNDPDRAPASRRINGVRGHEASRAVYRRHPALDAGYASRRPLTVRRTVVATDAPVPAPAPGFAGPGTLVTGPLGLASSLVSLPFRAVNGIFPATGDIATNPLVIIGAPLHAVGDIVQVPFRVIGAPFGGTAIATY